jgi:hypothetical protein
MGFIKRSITALLGFNALRALFYRRASRQDRALFVVTRCRGDPSQVQWTRVEYQGDDLQRTEQSVQVSAAELHFGLTSQATAIDHASACEAAKRIPSVRVLPLPQGP